VHKAPGNIHGLRATGTHGYEISIAATYVSLYGTERTDFFSIILRMTRVLKKQEIADEPSVKIFQEFSGPGS
jgi:hypothetical protein